MSQKIFAYLFICSWKNHFPFSVQYFVALFFGLKPKYMGHGAETRVFGGAPFQHIIPSQAGPHPKSLEELYNDLYCVSLTLQESLIG